MSGREWSEAVDFAVTVCDAGGAIVEMNQRAARMFEGRGGKSLIGSNVLDCHPEPARTKLRQLLERPQANTYTTERQGRRKLVHQAPWYRDGAFAGLVEIIVPLPEGMPHFVRDSPES